MKNKNDIPDEDIPFDLLKAAKENLKQEEKFLKKSKSKDGKSRSLAAYKQHLIRKHEEDEIRRKLAKAVKKH